jgi:sulfatase modifying factor 1
MSPRPYELSSPALVARLEQGFELAMALAVGLATPAAGLVALLALGSMSLDVDAVGERLVRWSGAGAGGTVGQGFGGAYVTLVPPATEQEPGEQEPERAAEPEPALTEPTPPEAASGSEGGGEASGPSRPIEQGGGEESQLAALVAEPDGVALLGSKHPGAGLPWGTVRHGTGSLSGGAGGGGGADSTGSTGPASAGPPASHSVDAAAGMRLVAIEGGGFWMGSHDYEPGRFDNEGPRHRVHLSPYWLAATEVTGAEWRAVMGSLPVGARGGNHPVVGVSWCDALRFANALSKREGLQPAYRFRGPCAHGGTVSWDRDADGYRLPTEAEWEHAARGGFEQRFAGSERLDGVGWYLDNAGGRARPVASLAANPFGLHDMSGNVWEWVWDRLGDYPAEAQHDPEGPAEGATRILRGGSWRYEARYARVADRNWGRPGYRSPAVGFRLARSLRPGDLDALVSEE